MPAFNGSGAVVSDTARPAPVARTSGAGCSACRVTRFFNQTVA